MKIEKNNPEIYIDDVRVDDHHVTVEEIVQGRGSLPVCTVVTTPIGWLMLKGGKTLTLKYPHAGSFCKSYARKYEYTTRGASCPDVSFGWGDDYNVKEITITKQIDITEY